MNTNQPIIDATIAYIEAFPDQAWRTKEVIGQSNDQSLSSRSNMAGHVTTSAIVMNEDFTKILLIDHLFFKMLLPPGGHYEGDRTLWEGARREVEEETGYGDLRLVVPFPVDISTHSVPERTAKNETAHRHHDFSFFAVADTTQSPQAQESEVASAEWYDIEELTDIGDPRTIRIVDHIRTSGLMPEGA